MSISNYDSFQVDADIGLARDFGIALPESQYTGVSIAFNDILMEWHLFEVMINEKTGGIYNVK